MNKEQTRLVDQLSKEMNEGNLAIFAGAGFSREAGFVDWKTLLKPVADDLDLDVEKEWDLVTLAQYHTNVNHANRAKLNQLLVTEFSANLKPTANHSILARLPISTYWTTNYDNLLESALQQNEKVADVKYTVKHLATTKPKRDAVVYKMHGDASHASEAILIRDDYERYHLVMQPFITALSGDLISKTFLFLGFSFTDPNLEYILSRVRIQYGRDQRQHHCILKKTTQGVNESQADFEYRQRKEQLFAGELLRVGVKVTYVDDYPQINEILGAIEYQYKRRSVFISGAAQDYSPFDQAVAERFVYDLSKEISKADFRIISGFGLGVGSAVISGVIEQTLMSGGRIDGDKLILRPFPQSQSGERPLPELWRDYRESMLAHAGVAIFLFGNKMVDGQVVLSSGMREEFEIAIRNGIFVIPVGITGWMSQELWQDLMSLTNFDSHPRGAQIIKLLKEIGGSETSLSQAKNAILALLKIM